MKKCFDNPFLDFINLLDLADIIIQQSTHTDTRKMQNSL